MSSGYLTLSEIISELRSLTNAKATGTFFVVSEEKHSAMFGFEQGRLVSLQCRLRSGEKALPLIAGIKRGTCRFDHGLNFVRRLDITLDNEDIFQSILTNQGQDSGVKSDPVFHAPPESTTRSSTRAKKALPITPDQKLEISRILNEELGPMGNLVMGLIEHCADFTAVNSVIQENAGDLGIENMLVEKIQAILKL
ncbi:MAG: hypothetical protein P8074_27875 [Anaerolineales bacterium]